MYTYLWPNSAFDFEVEINTLYDFVVAEKEKGGRKRSSQHRPRAPREAQQRDHLPAPVSGFGSWAPDGGGGCAVLYQNLGSRCDQRVFWPMTRAGAATSTSTKVTGTTCIAECEFLGGGGYGRHRNGISASKIGPKNEKEVLNAVTVRSLHAAAQETPPTRTYNSLFRGASLVACCGERRDVRAIESMPQLSPLVCLDLRTRVVSPRDLERLSTTIREFRFRRATGDVLNF
ncbi:hypothetical protein EDB92DRAFT_1819016 [Lactarius akahatsu]|uniref:Uncharacterized protein n=1 Tax=Lactarius akahatsu TaxID=416441 RepID=A0AAD4Q7J1_9AGAM|nr:hypothetical protein EDB92DRAFT_1819016 [Lactarius akahatsu]